jgi:citrate lyase subunit beta/citryl-CoA lyase
MGDQIRPRRSALYLPASNAKALAKARTLAADVIILDLEDAVAPEAKVSARDAAVAAVREGGFGRREIVVRINRIDTPWGRDDLDAVAAAAPGGVLVPKVDRPEDLAPYHAVLRDARIALWAMVETCRCIPALPEIAASAAAHGMTTLVMGTNDLAKEMHARPSADRLILLPALAAAIQAGRAHGLTVLDGVCNEFRDEAFFRAEAVQGAGFGFDGKTLIHPAQIDICNEAYSPSSDDIAWAEAVLSAFELPENRGKGAIAVGGKMVELLHLDHARRIREMGRLIGANAIAPAS